MLRPYGDQFSYALTDPGPFRYRQKGTNMYINYRLADGSVVLVEVTPETAEFILRNDREIANSNRKERYHAPYHLEALEYEGADYADPETPEDTVIRKEQAEKLNEILSLLTDTQLRRLSMKAEGMSLRQIAAAEETSVNAVRESLEAVKKKLEKHQNSF